LGFLFSILVLNMIENKGTPAGIAVNNLFGIVDIDPKLAADFSLKTVDGEEIILSSLRGKVVLLDYWSSWCAPCILEGKILAKKYDELKNMDVEFVGIAIWDSESNVLNFIEENKINYPIGIDTKGTIAIDYGLTGIPEKYLIDKNGVIRKKFVGPVEETQLENMIIQLLTEK
jgi:cytochrome c biogenesis protein CcmG/thiol:disulfide interchange protein DsbE